MKTVKFYAKDANAPKYEDYAYLGSMQIGHEYIHRANLIARAESIGGPIYGPLIALVDGEHTLRVLKY